MKLEDIGFYTLSDARARTANEKSPLQRCELILTDKCNFHCPYCRGVKSEYSGTISQSDALNTLAFWLDEGLKNVRFSGGEPTLYTHLVELVSYCKGNGVERVAVSTNGSASKETYRELLDAGVNDFSVSLDACCASTADIMSGTKGMYNKVLDNIRFLAGETYTTVGIVLTERNVQETTKIVRTAQSLGVSDIRVISAAQWNIYVHLTGTGLLNQFPIFKYRRKNLILGRNMRGIKDTDTNKCPLVLDDMAVVGGYHFPCIIYLREGGNPIGKVSKLMREDRKKWFDVHNTHKDEICRKNCLDVCCDYNNKWVSYHAS